MKSSRFHEIIKESGLEPGEVMLKAFSDERFQSEENRKKYPAVFDQNGKLKISADTSKEYFHTYCPFPHHPTEQKNGDSFAVFNKDQSYFCYAGCTSKPLNIPEMVMCALFDLVPDVAKDSELSKDYFWPSARWLVKNFGNKLGLKLSDIQGEGGFKKDIVQEILQVTVEYYHFLATKTKYAAKLDDYYLNTRYFKYAPVPFKKLKEDGMLGITPKSEEGNKLYLYLVKKGFKDEDILESHVCFRTEDGKIMDSFRNHAIVPYIYRKKVFGFYGKNFNPNAKNPHKRLAGHYDTPAGLDDISGFDEFFVVEGENSKNALKAMGFQNVMETMGARGFKDIHAEKIKKLREHNPEKMKKAFLVYDPDATGQGLLMKVGKQLVDIAGVEVLAIPMPVLTKNDEPWYVDTNDLFDAYHEKAVEVFLSLKAKAKSLDAFTLCYKLEEEHITTLSEARTALKRNSDYLNTVPKIERAFILEEVIDYISPSFENVGLSKDLLRNYLKELWLGQEVQKPIEGLEEVRPKHTYWIVTQDEQVYKKYKEKTPQLLLVRNLSHLSEKVAGKNILFDSSFNDGQMNNFKKFTNVYKAQLVEDPNGKVCLEGLKKI